jgi:hypothetical protein
VRPEVSLLRILTAISATRGNYVVCFFIFVLVLTAVSQSP